MKIIKQTYTLNNGVKIPKIGFGTWQIEPGKNAYDAVSKALKHGYRHIDTAAAYRNERSVGEALLDSGIKREEVFVTSKLESHIKSYQETLDAFDQTMIELNLDYLDLYLIHAPWPWNAMGKDCKEGNIAAYKAMEKLYREGRVRAIGVSNFNPDDLQNLLDHTTIVPQVNQIAYFIGIDQKATLDFCQDQAIFIEAYSPLGIGYLLENKIVQEVAHKYAVTPAQLAIRWCLEKGTAPLPKSVTESRIIENTLVDFVIAPEDMKTLDAIKGDPRRWN